jgi:hypothetical protein
MGNFIEIINNYEKRMGVVDKSVELNSWLFLITRFDLYFKQSINLEIE